MGCDCHSIGGLWSDRFEYRSVECFAFIIGIILWFVVGVMWKDRAIMVVHIGAFTAILTGYLNS
nr:DUF6552 family protein [Sulfitobacter algicola]